VVYRSRPRLRAYCKELGKALGAYCVQLIYLLVRRECVEAGTSRTGFIDAYAPIFVSVIGASVMPSAVLVLNIAYYTEDEADLGQLLSCQ
jgi:hypothetical protein